MVINNNKPKRAIIAYCALAQRLKTTGIARMQALTPFLAEACLEFSGEMFDAQKFSEAVDDRYEIKIPRLAVLGLAEQLANDGLLIDISNGNVSPIYKFADFHNKFDHADSPITERQVESILNDFVTICRADSLLSSIGDESLHDALLSRLLNIDSMRILTRKEGTISAKKTVDTLTVKQVAKDEQDKISTHLDYLVSEFLIDLRNTDTEKFEQISNVAFANMAAEALACFREPSEESKDLSNLTIYLDSPLLLDMLGVNSEYSDYGRELLDAIKASGAMPAVFEHCVNEAEDAIQAQLTYLRSGINQNSDHFSYSAKPDLLAALSGNVAERVHDRLGITVQKDPEVQLHKKFPTTIGDIESEMTTRMSRWGKAEAVQHDRKSIFTLIAISDSNQPSTKVCDSKWLFLTRNTPLVSIANDMWRLWLNGSNKSLTKAYIEKVSPIAMSDKQFSGYLWARSGTGNGVISRARLLAYCSSAIRPRADVKARAYNLVLELEGKAEADDIAALLEDTEGIRALMRATKGDPEDITKERLPHIVDLVKKSAGEYAAEEVRKEKDKEIESKEINYKNEANNLTSQIETKEQLLIKERLDNDVLKKANNSLQLSIQQILDLNNQRVATVKKNAHDKANFAYKLTKWISSFLFVFAITFAIENKTKIPIPNAIILVPTFGAFLFFWFVPELVLGRLCNWIARIRFRRVVELVEPSLLDGLDAIDFSKPSV
jgi:hypothetical protein